MSEWTDAERRLGELWVLVNNHGVGKVTFDEKPFNITPNINSFGHSPLVMNNVENIATIIPVTSLAGYKEFFIYKIL